VIAPTGRSKLTNGGQALSQPVCRFIVGHLAALDRARLVERLGSRGPVRVPWLWLPTGWPQGSEMAHDALADPAAD
jgi:hypothetical protein